MIRYYGERMDGQRFEIPVVPCLVCTEAAGEMLPEPPCQSTACLVCGTGSALRLRRAAGADTDVLDPAMFDSYDLV